MIKLNYVREFISLAETLNFSKAAELNFITQPALSRHIAELEEVMGGKLVNRSTRSVELTPAGRAVYEAFCSMMHSYYTAKETVSVLSAGKLGILKISSPYYWTEDFVEPIIHHFQTVNPTSKVIIYSCQSPYGLTEVAEGKSDLTLFIKHDDIADEMRRIPYSTERLCAVIRKGEPLSERESLSLGDIQKYPLVLFKSGDKLTDGINTIVLDLLAKRGIYPQNIHYTQQIDTLGITIQQTGGVSVMPYGVRHMDRSYLSFIPISDDDCVFPMCLYYHTDNNNPLIPLFVQSAKQVFDENLPR